jgi:hypothetical protein
MMMSFDDASVGDGRAARIEVFTRTRRRRPWSDEEKARIVAESYVDGIPVYEVVRRNGICPSQLSKLRSNITCRSICNRQRWLTGRVHRCCPPNLRSMACSRSSVNQLCYGNADRSIVGRKYGQ